MKSKQQQTKSRARGTSASLKRSLAQSTYISATWTWFLILAGKAAEPILVISVLYASVKLLPIVHFPPQLDVVIFIAQFVALDVGGLSLNTLAEQAKEEGNEAGAKQAKHLSLALVSVMLIGVIMAGVDQVVQLDGQVGTVIDTILLIARAVMAVLYSRVIHGLKKDDGDPPFLRDGEHLKALIVQIVEKAMDDLDLVERIAQTIQSTLAETLVVLREEMAAQREASHHRTWQEVSQRLDQCDETHRHTLACLKEEHATTIRETTERLQNMLETTFRKRMVVSPTAQETRQRDTGETTPVSHLTDLSQRRRVAETAAERKPVVSHLASGKAEKREIDDLVWPLLDAGQTVRDIAAQMAPVSTATVGRSRQRWVAARQPVSVSTSKTRQRTLTTGDDEINDETEVEQRA